MSEVLTLEGLAFASRRHLAPQRPACLAAGPALACLPRTLTWPYLASSWTSPACKGNALPVWAPKLKAREGMLRSVITAQGLQGTRETLPRCGWHQSNACNGSGDHYKSSLGTNAKNINAGQHAHSHAIGLCVEVATGLPSFLLSPFVLGNTKPEQGRDNPSSIH